MKKREDLVAGDEATVIGREHGYGAVDRIARIAKVARKTRTLIILEDDTRYSITTGHEFGKTHRVGERFRIVPTTDRHRHEKEHAALVQWIDKVWRREAYYGVKAASIDTLRTIASALAGDPAMRAEAPPPAPTKARGVTRVEAEKPSKRSKRG